MEPFALSQQFRVLRVSGYLCSVCAERSFALHTEPNQTKLVGTFSRRCLQYGPGLSENGLWPRNWQERSVRSRVCRKHRRDENSIRTFPVARVLRARAGEAGNCSSLFAVQSGFYYLQSEFTRGNVCFWWTDMLRLILTMPVRKFFSLLRALKIGL